MRLKHFIMRWGALILLAAATSPRAGLASDRPQDGLQRECGYPMCRFEKGNIDAVILAHARKSRTVMFGEIHDRVRQETPPPLEDSAYVMTLLQPLKAEGYSYLALEVNRQAPSETHSGAVKRFYADYRRGINKRETAYPLAKPGWIALIKRAFDLGYQILFIDTTVKGSAGWDSRDAAMFETIKTEIFDRDSRAKVLVYIGANHVSETASDSGFGSSAVQRKPLGLLLDAFTHGGNFSVFMGYPDDTPAGCDLVISRFIWETFNKDSSGE